MSKRNWSLGEEIIYNGDNKMFVLSIEDSESKAVFLFSILAIVSLELRFDLDCTAALLSVWKLVGEVSESIGYLPSFNDSIKS